MIQIVGTSADLTAFIKFPWKIYTNDRYWVPPLISDMKALLDEKKNVFWKHADRELFLAKDDKGNVVGRVAGVIDRNFIEFQEQSTGFFAFFECIDDTKVAQELLSAVASWLKQKGLTKMIGPTAPSTNDEMGLLYEGFDSIPYIMMPHNPRYYNELMEKCGLKKAKDLYAYIMKRMDAPYDRLVKLTERVKERNPGLIVRNINIKDYSNEVKRMREIYNNAWEKNWGFVPWTEEEFYAQCDRLKGLIVPEVIFMAMVGDRPVGMLVAVPNYNIVLQKLNGRLGPIEILKFLHYKKDIHTLRIMIMGMVKEYRNKGIEGLMYREIIANGPKLGYPEGEFSWILEDNVMMCRAAEMLGGKIYKTYRVYETELKQ